MVKRNSSSGLVYRKVDLHIHTPASHDYEDKDVTPEAIVEKALSKGLDAIAITDHNTGDFIDKIIEAAKEKLTVFPGVEISSEGGKDGLIHIIALFDPSKSTHDITSFLGALEYKPKSNLEELYTNKSPNEVIDKIHEHGGLAVPAHVNGDNGLLKDTRGNPRIDAIRNPRLLAVEATDCNDAEKAEKEKRICDFLDGSDPNYQRKLAVYQASDSHSLESIGSRYSYFKMEEISLAGLRQCFYDPDVRIKQMDNLEVWKYPKITRLFVTQGFLQDQVISFHEGLNSIVGGKGVGKSLIIELIRFALNQSSDDEIISKDHNGKLACKLGHLGEVHLGFEIENGERYQICRKFDGTDNEIKCQNLTTDQPFEGKIPRIIPVLAYSQNEIIKIAEDEQAQLRLIDSFYDPSTFHGQIHDIVNRLSAVDRSYADAINAVPELTEAREELRTLEEKLRHVNSSLEDELFKEMELLEKKEGEFQKHLRYHDGLTSSIDTFIASLNNEMQPPSGSVQFNNDTGLAEVYNLSNESFSQIQTKLSTCKEKIDVNRVNLTKIHDEWSPLFIETKTKYEEMLTQTGGDKNELERERKALSKNISEVREKVEKYQKKTEKLDEYHEKRNKLLDNLEDVYTDYYHTRKKVFDELTEKAGGRLELKIEKGANQGKFIEELVSVLAGSRAQRVTVEKITRNLSPRKFVDAIIQENSDVLNSTCKIPEQNAAKIIGFLSAKERFEDVLALCYRAYPEDVPSIKYRKDDGNYYALNELSVGQKCTALLIIALSDGIKPIIIDQPEDSLDNPSVYEDIVSKLRSGKEKRQFILTTHNSNVGVASDSDNFIIIEGTASCCTIKCCGAIDNEEVRSGIIDHLEGGDEPFELKCRKYNA